MNFRNFTYYHPVLTILFGVLGFILFIALLFYIIIASMIEEDKQLKECFFQSPKTAECEYKLWKYEHRNKYISSTTTVPMYIHR